jgi:hypothetical protein
MANIWAQPDAAPLIDQSRWKMGAPPPVDPSVWAPMEAAPEMPANRVAALAAPVNSPMQDQIANDREQLSRVRWSQAHPYGTPENHPGKLGKTAHVFSQLGNIAGDIFAPNVMAAIPGTQLGMQVREGGLANRLNEEIGQESQNAYRGAEQRKTETDTGLAPEKAASEEALQNAQTEGLKQPNLQHLESDQGIFMVNPKTKELTPLTFGGQPLMPHEKEPVAKGLEHGTLTAPGGGPMAANYNPTSGKWTDVSGKEIANPVPYEKPAAVPGVTVLVPGPDGTQTVQKLKVGQSVTPGTQTLTGGLNAPRQDIREHDKAYVQPAETVEKSYGMMDHAYREYEDARAKGQTLPTGAQSMLALSTHLSTTFGNVKGARVTKDMIHEHLGARSIGDSALVAVQKLTNGDQLSPDQWTAFHDLIKQSRNLQWATAVKEAARKHVPIDFLPPDLQSINKDGHQYDMGQDGQYHLKGAQ